MLREGIAVIWLVLYAIGLFLVCAFFYGAGRLNERYDNGLDEDRAMDKFVSGRGRVFPTGSLDTPKRSS